MLRLKNIISIINMIEKDLSENQSDSAEYIDVLNSFSWSPFSEVRNRTAQLLADIQGQKSTKTLLRLSNDPCSLVRANACDSLSGRCFEKVELQMRKRMCDRNYLVRMYAATSLFETVKQKAYIPKEEQFLHERYVREKNPVTKACLCVLDYALQKSPVLSEADILLMLKDDDPYVRNCIIKTLEEIRPYCDTPNVDSYLSGVRDSCAFVENNRIQYLTNRQREL